MMLFPRGWQAGLAACLVWAFAVSSALAQFSNISPTGVNAAFGRLFGAHTNFTSKVDVQVLDKQGKDWVRLPATLAALDGKLRMELDLAQAASRDLPEFAINSLKQAGMNHIISIVRPDKKATFLVYPGAESYLNMPLTAEDARALEKGYKVETVPAGKEKLDGKERARNNVVVRDFSGASALKATTWTAPELKDFPAQIETRQDEATIVLKFSEVQFNKPGAAQFEVPAAFTEYTDMQKMMYGIMKRIVANAAQGQ
jgi:hypothetical protein